MLTYYATQVSERIKVIQGSIKLNQLAVTYILKHRLKVRNNDLGMIDTR